MPAARLDRDNLASLAKLFAGKVGLAGRFKKYVGQHAVSHDGVTRAECDEEQAITKGNFWRDFNKDGRINPSERHTLSPQDSPRSRARIVTCVNIGGKPETIGRAA